MKKIALSLYKTKLFMLVAILLLFSTQTNAQDSSKSRNPWSAGFQLNEYGNDFGFGLHAITPRLFGYTHLFIGYDYQLFQHKAAIPEEWIGFNQFRLSLVTKMPVIPGKIDVYGSGGTLLALIPESLSSKSIAFSGTGTFGLQVYWYEHFSYFFELGGYGRLIEADNLANRPTIGGGFTLSVGGRVIF